jgi:uncharacterized protein (DUF2461 family)
MHRPATDQLERFRGAIDDDRAANRFERALVTAGAAGLTPAEPELKRAPRGYRPDHPRVEGLRMKRLTVSRLHPLEPWLHQRGCDERIRSELESARPLVTWLAETIGPSAHPRRD